MASSRVVFERTGDGSTVPAGLPLVVLLTGFTDAGGAVSGAVDYFRSRVELTPLATFDDDELLDFRARRPIITFDRDHFTDYVPQRLELSLARDALGQRFLLLAGYEPDFAWNAFIAAVLELASEFAVTSLTWAHAIAMPVPHTRDLGATVSGNRTELIASQSAWQPRTQLPATAAHLLEYRAEEIGMDVAGFALLVPHYLADTEYPAAISAVLDRIAASTGRVFDLVELREENADFLRRVEEQIGGNDELGAMLHALEQRYDAYVAHRAAGETTEPLIDESDLPSADELAAELERFLASRPTADGEGEGPFLR
ncbi:MAG: PAC2 family protein [Microbacterium sp.]